MTMTTPSPDQGEDVQARAVRAQPIVTVPMPRRKWNDDETMDLPADAASHWDERAWNRC